MESPDKIEKIGNVAEFKRGPFGSSIKKSVCIPKGPNTFKLYEQGNVINNDFERDRYYLTKEKFDELNQFEIKPGDLLLTCAGTLGKIAIVPGNIQKGIINSVLMRIRVNEDKILEDYMYYYFKSPKIQNDISKQSAGVAIKNLFSTKLLKEYTLYLPDKEQQQLIVDEIEKQLTRLEDSIESLKKVKVRLDVYKNAILKKSFEKKEGWKNDKISDICDVKGGKRLPKGESFSELITDHPYLRVVDFKNYTINSKNICYIDKTIYDKISRYVIFDNEVFISIAGTIGRVGMIPSILNGANLTENAAKLTDIKDVFPKYLMYYLSSPYARVLIKFSTKSTSQPKLALFRIGKLLISYPKEIFHQQKIVSEIEAKFSIIDNVEKVVDGALLKSEQLRKSILKKAFEGRLVKPMEIKCENN